MISSSIQIHRAGFSCTVIACIAIDTRCSGILKKGTHSQGIAVSRQGYGTEIVIRTGITGLDIGLLTPAAAGAREQIHRTSFTCSVIAFIAIDPRGRGMFLRGTNRQGIAVS